ncbi:Uncharacterised protein [Vibrio cholerae]|nr:Uncharacterised protein [Vibrio cholerae]
MAPSLGSSNLRSSRRSSLSTKANGLSSLACSCQRAAICSNSCAR